MGRGRVIASSKLCDLHISCWDLRREHKKSGQKFTDLQFLTVNRDFGRQIYVDHVIGPNESQH